MDEMKLYECGSWNSTELPIHVNVTSVAYNIMWRCGVRRMPLIGSCKEIVGIVVVQIRVPSAWWGRRSYRIYIRCRVSPAGFRRDYDRYHAQILKYVFADVNGEACCVALPFSLNVNSRLNIHLVNRRVTYPRRHCLLAAGPNSFIQFINLFIRRDQIVASLLNWT